MIEDTIAAISTPLGEGGIGIVRITGENSIDIADKVFKGKKKVSELKSHTINHGKVIDPVDGNMVDEVLLSVMRKPNTFTREDVVEINCHGGILPLKQILSIVLDNGARLAEPGEFSKRAFLNGRIDLAQAESIIDIIKSKTEKSLSIAVNNLEGSLSEDIKSIRTLLTNILARIEVNIDFPDEDPEAHIDTDELADRLEKIIVEIDRLLKSAGKGKIFREGLKAVIVGKTNVGKSSLLNCLLEEKRAIVTDVPGTTRDVIEEMLNFGGIPLKIIDTAGIRKTEDTVEKIGVERSRKSIREADLVIVVLDGVRGLSEEDMEIIKIIKNKKHIFLVNKIDLVDDSVIDKFENKLGEKCIPISAKKGSGLENVEAKIKEIVESESHKVGEALVTRSRHERALKDAREYLKESLKGIKEDVPFDIAAIDVREARNHLGEITGDTVSEDILDKIFSEFCIGK